MVEPLVVVVDGNGQDLLGVILADHIVVENLADLFRGRNAVARLHQRGFVLLADDVHAQFDTFVADEYGRPRNELANFVLALAAERAVQGVLRIAAADFAHSILRNTLPHIPWSASLRLVPSHQPNKFRTGIPARRPCFREGPRSRRPLDLKGSRLTA